MDMEEDNVSVISSAEVNAANSDVSDSISTNHPPANKRIKHDTNTNIIVTSSQYKGVMRQKNGQWGAQLYANHTRIWLGTFKTEQDAAMAYDSAAIKFRSGDTHRNFPLNDFNSEEPTFQTYYSRDAVLSMIKDGSYQYRYMDYLNFLANARSSELEIIDLDAVGTCSNEGMTCKQLFQKELTPSDVGKLNRLVIPKKYAVKYFPPVSENDKENVDGNNGNGYSANDAELVFYDKFMRLWKFRYCYWNSSQSFVFTRGWSRFLRSNNLKANDVISFYECEQIKENNEVHVFLMIDSSKFGNDDNDCALIEAANLQVGREVDLQLRLGHSRGFDVGNQVSIKQEFVEKWPEHELMAEHTKAEGVKLFGVLIN